MNPYLNIWFKIKPTLNSIISGKQKFYWGIPYLLTSMTLSIDMSAQISEINLLTNSLGICITICFSFILLAYFIPATYYIMGKLWKGQASFKQLQIAFSLSLIPVFLILIVQLFHLIFHQEFLSINSVQYFVLFTSWLFYARTLIISISKVQNFSYGIALLNIFLPYIILLILTYKL